MKRIEILKAEIRNNQPFMMGRERRDERNFDETLKRRGTEYGPVWMWYMTWDQYDRFWKKEAEYGQDN